MDQEIKISNFYKRIADRREETILPEALNGLITHSNLHRIYGYIESSKEEITKEFKNNNALRYDKKETGLSHTINLVLDPNNDDEIRLVLETKRKNEAGVKDFELQTFSGVSKVVKPAWAIDGQKPQKMANAVIYLSSMGEKKDAEQDAEAVKSIVRDYPGQDLFLNTPSLGAIINKTGVRKKDRFISKISLYSYWADCGSLADFLWTDEGLSLSVEQKNNMTFQLAKAIDMLHSKDCIHQDIKPSNILVYRNGQGGYRLELADFEAMFDSHCSAENEIQTTAGYESPEIAYINKDPGARCHEYFYGRDRKTYGQDFLYQLESEIEENKLSPRGFDKPNKANDMWALGITLFELYFLRKPKLGDSLIFPEIMKDLLHLDRNKRLTAQEFFEWVQKELLIVTETPLMIVKKNVSPVKIDEFFQRISERRQTEQMPNELSEFIEYDDLNNIYNYIMSKETTLRTILQEGRPYHLGKKQSGLAHTLDFIFENKTNNVLLMLGIKRKNESRLKLAWRIDGVEPQMMANEVNYLDSKHDFLEAMREVNIATEVMKKKEGEKVYLNNPSRGMMINKEGKHSSAKMSLYYPWPFEQSLKKLLENFQASLTLTQKVNIAEQLIRAVKALHDEEMIHQKIKPENILVYKNAQNDYHILLSGFYGLYEPSCFNHFDRMKASKNSMYESPEMAFYNKGKFSENKSLGQECLSDIKDKFYFSKCDKANDAWALGIVLYELFYGKKPTKSNLKKEQCRPFIKRLLEPVREKRATVQEALLGIILEKGATSKKEADFDMKILEIKIDRLSFSEDAEKHKIFPRKKRRCWDCLFIKPKKKMPL